MPQPKSVLLMKLDWFKLRFKFLELRLLVFFDFFRGALDDLVVFVMLLFGWIPVVRLLALLLAVKLLSLGRPELLFSPPFVVSA